MNVLPFPSRQLSCEMPSDMPPSHEHRRYDGFSRQHNPKADHAFWRPVVNRGLVDVAGIPDTSSADVFDGMDPGHEYVWDAYWLCQDMVPHGCHDTSSALPAPAGTVAGNRAPTNDSDQFPLVRGPQSGACGAWHGYETANEIQPAPRLQGVSTADAAYQSSMFPGAKMDGVASTIQSGRTVVRFIDRQSSQAVTNTSRRQG